APLAPPPSNTRRISRSGAELARLASELGLDLLHLHGAWGREEMAVEASLTADLPLVASLGGLDLGLRLYENLASLQALVNVARVLVCPATAQKLLVERLLNPAARVAWVPPHAPRPEPPARPAPLYLSGAVVGCLGPFSRASGLDLLLEAFTRLAARRDASLLLVGPHFRWESFHHTTMMDHHPEAQRIARLGALPRERARSYLAACSALAFPSVVADTPLNLLEGMTVEVPLVASRGAGHEDFVREGVDGLLHDARDPSSLSAALEELLDAPQRAADMARSARLRAHTEFTPERELAGWLRCYREALA
ncbi:MAG: glycosyltransferase family 4 protein, partial [Candidatus Eremiobacterota bacterium]